MTTFFFYGSDIKCLLFKKAKNSAFTFLALAHEQKWIHHHQSLTINNSTGICCVLKGALSRDGSWKDLDSGYRYLKELWQIAVRSNFHPRKNWNSSRPKIHGSKNPQIYIYGCATVRAVA
jgi:hypothetical protein